MTTKGGLLEREQKILSKLYDAEAMMSIKANVASGFIVLLGGVELVQNKPKSKTQKEADISLGFLALTQGNVLDACFGVTNPNRREDTPATRSAKEAKELLDESASSDLFRQTAVKSYLEAFRIVVDHHEKMNKLNCITACFRSKKIRRNTERELAGAFLRLGKAVGESH